MGTFRKRVKDVTNKFKTLLLGNKELYIGGFPGSEWAFGGWVRTTVSVIRKVLKSEVFKNLSPMSSPAAPSYGSCTFLCISYCTCLVKGQARHPVWIKFWQTLAEGPLRPFSFLQTAEPAAARTSDCRDWLLMTSGALKVNRGKRAELW